MDIDCGGPSDEREIAWLGFSLVQVRLVKRGVAVECSPDITPGSVVLCPFRRSTEVHLVPTDKPAGSAKEWRNLVVGEGGDGGRGRARRHSRHRGGGQGPGQNRRGARVLDLRKQETLEICNIVIRDMDQPTMASDPAALSNPVPLVLREVGHFGTVTGRGRPGETRGRRRGGRGSRQWRAFDPQNRGGARRPRPQGGHGDHCTIGWGRRNPGRKRSLPRSHIKSITCQLLQRGAPIPRHKARAQGTGWVRL